MAFGQSQGPQAGSRMLDELLELLQAAGHADFRDARGPMGFTQRQANGKFTIAEAEAFIAELQERQHRGEIPQRFDAPAPTVPDVDLRFVPDALLAAELQRRNWIVVEP